ncbi:uncharacterized protein N7500_010127 [Penicillium coprophilum]|uniref:uncharacterized protein n=1 Tax=Penicillium coprophilum TaxID=36646 RepID=UPI002383D288|nr:uncharacterized protein N7500_010127 [Penicillium coprophilum]KAJ5154688.1 hypothetical protein N7500_010127 [Penicillium coprophilum]
MECRKMEGWATPIAVLEFGPTAYPRRSETATNVTNTRRKWPMTFVFQPLSRARNPESKLARPRGHPATDWIKF